ncbi:hypothetical protein SESBI_04122 [Sesbania bispinosa]|nr:hypothetical protein SESBI_04122 [Sesbania bispinosa]
MKLADSMLLVTLALLLSTAISSDLDPLQDLCVADLSSGYRKQSRGICKLSCMHPTRVS